ncbi:MAG: hypothetical protein AB7H43_01270 [Acidimicrobiia bacterium]
MTDLRDAETGGISGTADRDDDNLWLTGAGLRNGLRLEVLVSDEERAGDEELASSFRKAQAESRKGAEPGRQLLAAGLYG